MRLLSPLVQIAILFVLTSMMSVAASAAPSGVTYQGRILKPDGSPLSGANVQFRLQLRSPDAANCLMFEEVQALDMRNSNGAFSLTMADGSGSRMDTTGWNLDRIFANRGTFTFPASSCTSGTTYAPSPSDGRNLVVLFKDETLATWEPIPASRINFIPFAFESIPAAGAFTGTHFERLHQDQNFYVADKTRVPNLNWAITNSQSFESARECAKGGCLRMRQGNGAYNAHWGNFTQGALGFYEFFCATQTQAQCDRVMALSLRNFLTTTKAQKTSFVLRVKIASFRRIAMRRWNRL